MQAEQIDARMWRVTEEDGDPNPGGIHHVGLDPATGSEASAIAMVQAIYAPAPELSAGDRAVAELQSRRSVMVCSRLQGRLTAGPAICATLDATAADPATPWAMRETILNANEWRRTSQTIDEMAWVLGFTAEEMDALFDAAMQVSV